MFCLFVKLAMFCLMMLLKEAKHVSQYNLLHNKSNVPMYSLLDVILKAYLAKTYCLSIFTDTSLKFIDDISSIPILYNDISTNTSALPSMILNSFDYGCSDFIIRLENPKEFIETFDENIHITNQRRGNRKLIFVPTDFDIIAREKLVKILKMKAVEFIPDILLILPKCYVTLNNSCFAYELATHKYVGTERNDMIIFDTWHIDNKSFEMNSNLFPDKISDLQGMIMKAATFSYKPYALLELDDNDTIIGLDGTEMRFGLEFCNWSNCTMTIVRDDESEWGEIWENRTGNGILGNIVTDRADIGFGALYSWYHEYLFLDLSMPIIRTGITCIAPAPQLIPSWLLPILPFDSAMWSSVFIASGLGAITLFATAKTGSAPYTPTDSAFGIIGIMLMQISQVPAVTNPPPAFRHALSWLLLLSLMLSNAYSSGLSSSITVPKYEEPINTVQQLVDSKLDWGATHDAWIFSILLSTEPNMVSLIDKFKKWPEKLLQSKGKTRDFAYSIERLPAGHYAIGEYVTEQAIPYLQLMQQDIYWEQCVIMARKSSPFSRRINTLLGRLHQSGLMHAWETQVVLKHSNFAVQLGVHLSQRRRSGDGERPHAIAPRSLQGVIYIWGLGLMAATLAFVYEICRKPKNKGKKLEPAPYEFYT